jgi:ribonuclease HIII/DNA-directed RNA polymerase subunit RPC12/RpoP
MNSNFVFVVQEEEKYKKFKENLSLKYAINSIEIKQKSLKDIFYINTPYGKITFSYFINGKLVIQGSPTSPILQEINNQVSKIFQTFKKEKVQLSVIDLKTIDKEFFIGLDEAGVGETFGSMFLGKAIISKENLLKLAAIKKPTNVKKYDRNGILNLHSLGKKFFIFSLKKFSAYSIDMENKIDLLDQGYIELLKESEKILPDSCVIIDDYGLGFRMLNFVEDLKRKGTKVIILQKADEAYLPAMFASVIARKARLTEMEKIMKDNILVDQETSEKIYLGSGGASDPLTEKWLRTYRKLYPYSDFPPFVRRKWKNVQKIESEIPKQPMIFSFKCYKCGANLNKLQLTFNKIRNSTELYCSECKNILEKNKVSMFLKNKPIVVDTSVLMARIISKDLLTAKYFEGTKIILPSCLYEEIDRKGPSLKKGAEREIEFLKEAERNGQITLEEFDTEAWLDLSYDKKIMNVCKVRNAAILTWDKPQSSWSSLGTFVFEVV